MTVHVPTFRLERELIAQGFALVAGMDEAGCGCWAGPVVAAAIILPLDSRIGLIRDSKSLTAQQRRSVMEKLKAKVTAWAVGIATPEEIDRFNIRKAGVLAMRRALDGLSVKPHYVLTDAFHVDGLAVPCKAVVNGDREIKSVAAASVIAKTERDHLMDEFDARFPGYGFSEHKGYGTKRHQAALKRLGPSPIHRRSYAPMKALIRDHAIC